MKTGCYFGRLVSSYGRPMESLTTELVEELPLCNPVSADTWAERFHLLVKVIEFFLQDLRPLVELELCEALGQDSLDLIERVRFEQIQDHGIADHELAVDRFRMAG